MAKVKTYWDEIKDQETFYYGGNRGWEIHLRWENTYTWDRKTGENKVGRRLQFQFPFCPGDGVPAAEKALVRKEVTTARKKEKMLAQASRNREEFRDLYARISDENWDEIVATGLKGFDLGKYIRERYLTHNESYSLFYRM